MTPAPTRPAPARTVFETVLYAADVPAAAAFYRDVLGLPPLRPPAPNGAVFRLAADSMLLIFDPVYAQQPGRGAPHHGTTGQGHAALRIDESDYDAWRAWLTEKGVQIEMEMKWPPGGRSIYFRDPAGNSLELAAGNVWGM